MRDFLQGRIRLVRELIASDIDISYADLVLILCSVISACAARRWPGKRIDRPRFVELLANHSPADTHMTWVCVPALINDGLIDEAGTPYATEGCTRIFCDDEIDLNLPDAGMTYPGVSVEQLKSHTYAALIYEFMPVDLEIDDSDKSMRSVELNMVIDYGFGELNDGFGREWDFDNTDPTS